jgi:hypothetical protein
LLGAAGSLPSVSGNTAPTTTTTGLPRSLTPRARARTTSSNQPPADRKPSQPKESPGSRCRNSHTPTKKANTRPA